MQRKSHQVVITFTHQGFFFKNFNYGNHQNHPKTMFVFKKIQTAFLCT